MDRSGLLDGKTEPAQDDELKQEFQNGLSIEKLSQLLGRHEGSIKNFIKNYYSRLDKKLPDIGFELITKKSPAHKVAIDTFRGIRKADVVVDAKEVLKYLF